jgi:hypothetical protein
MTDNELPYRLRESTFRVYEPYIRAAISAAPEPVTFSTGSIRPTTFAARLRDAIISFNKFNWPNSSFTQFELQQANLTVRHNDLAVIVGTKIGRGHLGGEARAFVSPNHKRLDGLPVLGEQPPEVIKAFCILLGKKLIPSPVILEDITLDDATISDLESHHDISITINEVGKTILI